MPALDFSRNAITTYRASNMRSASQNAQIKSSQPLFRHSSRTRLYRVESTQGETASELLHDSRFRAPLYLIGGNSRGALRSSHNIFLRNLALQLTAWRDTSTCFYRFFARPNLRAVLDMQIIFSTYYLVFFLWIGLFYSLHRPRLYVAYISSIILGLGGGNLWTVTLSHLTVYTDEARKGLIVSSFVFQVTSCVFLAKRRIHYGIFLLKIYVASQISCFATEYTCPPAP